METYGIGIQYRDLRWRGVKNIRAGIWVPRTVGGVSHVSNKRRLDEENSLDEENVAP